MKFVSSLLTRLRLPRLRRKLKTLGQRGEDLAAAHLRKAGYRILHRNLVLGKNEIDIIAQTGGMVVFVEVKTRVSDDYAAPEISVTAAKRRKLSKAGARFIQQTNDDSLYYRYDIIAVVMPPDGPARINHIVDAFPPE